MKKPSELSDTTPTVEYAMAQSIAIGMFIGPCITQKDANKAVKEWAKRPLKERIPYEKDALRVIRALRGGR